ncbi:MAG: MFS transporter [Frankiales bacterium]|nr:MAG: MFS transporter [Frankiales bacterium]
MLVLSSHFRHTALVDTQPAPRVGYREVLAVREFRGLLVSDGLSTLGDQVARIAVALLVLERSGSAFAASATYACSYLTWLVGGPLLSALPDRYPRRRVMVACDLLRGLLVACLAVPGLPLWVVFAVLIAVGLLAPPAEAARSALLADVLDGEPYVVANALSNAVGQAGQVGGFVLGGALVGLVGVEGALLADAASFALSALILLAYVHEHVVTRVAGPTASMLVEAGAGAMLVWGSPRLRSLLAWGLLSAASVIAAEGLAVAITQEQSGGPLAAGVLTAAVPAGFLLGSWLLLRVAAERRERLFPWLVALSCLPLMATPLVDSLTGITLLWVLAGCGNALQLVANSSFVQAVPAHLRGRAFGVAVTLLMVLQGVVLLAAGALAETTDARLPIALVAVVCLALVPVLSRLSQGFGILRRGSGG